MWYYQKEINFYEQTSVIFRKLLVKDDLRIKDCEANLIRAKSIIKIYISTILILYILNRKVLDFKLAVNS